MSSNRLTTLEDVQNALAPQVQPATISPPISNQTGKEAVMSTMGKTGYGSRYTTLMHVIFDKVEVDTYHVSRGKVELTTWSDPDYREDVPDVEVEDCLDYVLDNVEYSFILPTSEFVRVIRVWKKHTLVTLFTEFIELCGIGLDFPKPVGILEGNMFSDMLSDDHHADMFTKNNLRIIWNALQGVSIGKGANKDIDETLNFGHKVDGHHIADVHTAAVGKDWSVAYGIDGEKLIDASNKVIGKWVKYLKRMLAPHRYMMLGDVPVVTVEMDITPYEDGWTCSVDKGFARHRLGWERVEVGDRASVTGKLPDSFRKGHAGISDHPKFPIIMFGEQGKDFLKSLHTNYFSLEPVHGSDEVWLDEWTWANMLTTFKPGILQGWAKEEIADAIRHTRDGVLPDALTRLDKVDFGQLGTDQWGLRRMAINKIPMLVPVQGRKVWTFYTKGLNNVRKTRIKIPGAIRRYAAPDIVLDTTGEKIRLVLSTRVSPGQIRIMKNDMLINQEDADWFHTLHGGSDSDDGFVIIPLTGNLKVAGMDGHIDIDGKSIYCLIYRNPNQLGEWSVMKLHPDSDWMPDTFNALELPISQRNAAGTPDMSAQEIMANSTNYWKSTARKKMVGDSGIIHRAPKKLREELTFTDGPVAQVKDFVQLGMKNANEFMTHYFETRDQMVIPDELIHPRTPMYDVAQAFRGQYGSLTRAAIAAAGKRAYKERDNYKFDPVDYKGKLISRVESKMRGVFSQYTPEQQKLLVMDLMRLCYSELVGKVYTVEIEVKDADGNVSVVEEERELTQNNDGVLGIPSSAKGLNRGTWDVLLDILGDFGYGTTYEVVDTAMEDKAVYALVDAIFGSKTYAGKTKDGVNVVGMSGLEEADYDANGISAQLWGHWRNLANKEGAGKDLSDKVRDKFIKRSHRQLQVARTVEVRGNNVFVPSRDDVFSKIKSTGGVLVDGTYQVVTVGDAGRTLTAFLTAV